MTHRRLLAGLALAVVCGGRPAAGEPVRVELRDRAVVTRRCVRLADVADLAGGTDAVRRQLGEIDVDALPADGPVGAVSRRQVEYRLRLAGVPPDAAAVAGAPQTQLVAARQPLRPEQVEAAATDALRQRLPWPAADLAVRLVQPVVAHLPAVADDEQVTFQAEPSRPDVGLGRVQMNVTIRVDGEKRLALPVFLEAAAVQEVALTRRPLERGEVVTADDVIRERRPVPAGGRPPVRPDAAAGRRARRALPPGLVLTAADVEADAAEPARGEALVRAGQPVRLTAKVGAMTIVTTGDALQDGRLGQTVRVRNAATQKLLAGRVTAAQTVEVDPGGR